jgi:hypothetical protein
MKTSNTPKPKIKENKLGSNPLFIKFLNWKGDKYHIENLLRNVQDNFESNRDKEIVQTKLNELDDVYLDNLTNFQKVFKKHLLELITNKGLVNDLFLAWLSNCYKYIDEQIDVYLNDEYRKISIKDNVEDRWFESIVCYNFIMTHNYFGGEIIKSCSLCSNFFAHKGKYARYCSESCKEISIEKRKNNGN